MHEDFFLQSAGLVVIELSLQAFRHLILSKNQMAVQKKNKKANASFHYEYFIARMGVVYWFHPGICNQDNPYK
jgi:hypothetical protein